MRFGRAGHKYLHFGKRGNFDDSSDEVPYLIPSLYDRQPILYSTSDFVPSGRFSDVYVRDSDDLDDNKHRAILVPGVKRSPEKGSLSNRFLLPHLFLSSFYSPPKSSSFPRKQFSLRNQRTLPSSYMEPPHSMSSDLLSNNDDLNDNADDPSNSAPSSLPTLKSSDPLDDKSLSSFSSSWSSSQSNAKQPWMPYPVTSSRSSALHRSPLSFRMSSYLANFDKKADDNADNVFLHFGRK